MLPEAEDFLSDLLGVVGGNEWAKGTSKLLGASSDLDSFEGEVAGDVGVGHNTVYEGRLAECVSSDVQLVHVCRDAGAFVVAVSVGENSLVLEGGRGREEYGQ